MPAEPGPEFPPGDGQIADELTRLPVHGEEEILVLPFRVQHPDWQQGVFHRAPVQADILGSDADGAVALGGGCQHTDGGVFRPVLGPGGAGVGINVVLIGQVAG